MNTEDVIADLRCQALTGLDEAFQDEKARAAKVDAILQCVRVGLPYQRIAEQLGKTGRQWTSYFLRQNATPEEMAAIQQALRAAKGRP